MELHSQDNKPLKVLIVGARSKTAEAITRVLRTETSWKIILFSSGVSHEEHSEYISIYPASYNDTKSAKEVFLREIPDVVINTAAMTNVDGCELNRKEAWQANVKWVEFLLHMCKIIDARLIHFSTDYIFDGIRGPYTEADVPNPINYYGRTKLAGENLCRLSNIPCAIIRTNVVYGISSYEHTDFVQWTLSKLREREKFHVVTDQYSNPTLTDDLGLAVYRIILKRREGIYNVAGGEWLNRHEFARKIANVFQFDSDIIHPCITDDIRQRAKRPLRGGLVTLKAETDLGIKSTTAEAGLITLRQQLLSMAELDKKR